MMYCMMQMKQLSLHIRLNNFFTTNNQNRQQNKLVNIINGNDSIKHNFWPYKYLTICFLNPDVYILKTEGYLHLYIAYIFSNDRILHIFFETVFIYSGLKYETLRFALHLSLYFSPACFYIIFVS